MRQGKPERGNYCNRLQPPCGGVAGACAGVDGAVSFSTGSSIGADGAGAEEAGAVGTEEGVTAGAAIGALGTVEGGCWAGFDNSPAAAGAAGCSAMMPRFC